MRLDPNYVQNLSVALDASSQRQSDLTAELSSGLRVSNLSTDPTVTSTNSLLNTAISQQDAYIQVATSEVGRLQVADSSLSETTTQLTAAITLGTQASNGTLNQANLSAIQQQVKGIRDTVVSLANTTYTGTYIFAGTLGTTKPFSVDNGIPAAVTYAGDGNTQTVTTPGGQQIAVGIPGNALFTPVLTALNQLIADLGNPVSAGNSVTVAADTSALSAALTQLSGQRTVVGNSLARLQSTSTYAQGQESSLKITQSGLVSSDYSSVATELKAQSIQHEALLNVIAGLSKSDLFDYLK